MIQVQKFKPTKQSQLRGILLLIIMLGFYLVDNAHFFSFKNTSTYIYAIKPLMWSVVILIVYLFPRMKSTGKIRLSGDLKWWSGCLAVAYIMVMLGGGIIYGFGKSPYDLSPKGIIRNIFVAFTPIISKELIRAYLINSIKGKRVAITISMLAVLYTLLGTPLNKLMGLRSWLEALEYVGENILPELSRNIIAGNLVSLGGASLSIIYLGVIQGFYWLSPILPDLNWVAKAVIGTLCPIFSLIFIEYFYTSRLRFRKKTYEEKENPLGWIATITFSLAIIWFAAGVFPVYPSVIVTGSMIPMVYPGDVVIVRKIDGKNAKLGDVIQYKSENIFIFHRVIDIIEEKNQLKFQAKGDNNSRPDSELVDPGLVKGRVIKVIPKIGWPSLLLRSRNGVQKERVEF